MADEVGAHRYCLLRMHIQSLIIHLVNHLSFCAVLFEVELVTRLEHCLIVLTFQDQKEAVRRQLNAKLTLHPGGHR